MSGPGTSSNLLLIKGRGHVSHIVIFVFHCAALDRQVLSMIDMLHDSRYRNIPKLYRSNVGIV